MLMRIGLGLLSLCILFGFWPLPLFLIATAAAGIYFVALATIFSGTAWAGPEFAQDGPRPLGLHPQQLVSCVVCVILTVGVVLAVK